jgi:hypothetical protein
MSKETTAVMQKAKEGTASTEQLGAVLKDLTVGAEVTSEYLKFEEGEETRAWFVGMTKISKIEGESGETTDAVKLILEDGSNAINADKVVVSTCRNFKESTPILIQCTGLAGAKGRQYKTFKIHELGK